MGIVKELVSHKKTWLLILLVVVVILNRVFEWNLTAEDLAFIASADIATILGFGLQDKGEKAAKALAAAKTDADPQ
jgi:hypothetical protein